MKVVWCVTGAGHLLAETVEVMRGVSDQSEVYAAFTQAGEEVAWAYRLLDEIKDFAVGVYLAQDQGAANPVSASRRFDVAVVAPATANTVAKIAHGIADTLATNIAAQSLKVGRRVIVLPTDAVKDIETAVPSGNKVKLTARGIDLENVKRLEKMTGVVVVASPAEIKEHLK